MVKTLYNVFHNRVRRMNTAVDEPKGAQPIGEEAQCLDAWWSLIRATILVVFDAQRQSAQRGIEK